MRADRHPQYKSMMTPAQHQRRTAQTARRLAKRFPDIEFASVSYTVEEHDFCDFAVTLSFTANGTLIRHQVLTDGEPKAHRVELDGSLSDPRNQPPCWIKGTIDLLERWALESVEDSE